MASREKRTGYLFYVLMEEQEVNASQTMLPDNETAYARAFLMMLLFIMRKRLVPLPLTRLLIGGFMVGKEHVSYFLFDKSKTSVKIDIF